MTGEEGEPDLAPMQAIATISRGSAVFVALLPFLLAMFFATQFDDRYILFSLPFFSIIMILGIKGVVQLIRVCKKLQSLVIILLFLIMFYFSVSFSVTNVFAHIIFLRPSPLADSVDSWLMKNDPGKRIMTHHEGVGFYSKSFIIYSPDVINVRELLDYAHLWKADYLVVGGNETPSNLAFLETDPKDYPGLKLMSLGEKVIYKILK